MLNNISCFCIAIFFSLFSLSSISACLKEGDNVVLTGVLKKEMAYGPPGWGEDPAHDEQEHYWVLYLDKPLGCVTDAVTDERADWDTILQLDLWGKGINKVPESYLDQHMTVSGRLELQETANDDTPVMITDIKSINAVSVAH